MEQFLLQEPTLKVVDRMIQLSQPPNPKNPKPLPHSVCQMLHENFNYLVEKGFFFSCGVQDQVVQYPFRNIKRDEINIVKWAEKNTIICPDKNYYQKAFKYSS